MQSLITVLFVLAQICDVKRVLNEKEGGSWLVAKLPLSAGRYFLRGLPLHRPLYLPARSQVSPSVSLLLSHHLLHFLDDPLGLKGDLHTR